MSCCPPSSCLQGHTHGFPRRTKCVYKGQLSKIKQCVYLQQRSFRFGLSLSTSVICVEAVTARLRQWSICLATKLNNWLLLAQSQQETGACTCSQMTSRRSMLCDKHLKGTGCPQHIMQSLWDSFLERAAGNI